MKRLYLILICCLLLATYASGQTKRRKASPGFNKANDENKKFLQKQWWLGVKAGPNLTKASVIKAYAILAPTNYEAALVKKKYENFKQLGSQVSVEVTFYFKGFSLSLQPTYQNSRFQYSNHYEWTDTEVSTNALKLDYKQEQKIEHALLPLLLKYEFTSTKIRPYVELGIYSGFLLNATKTVTITGTDEASGGTNTFKNEPIIVGAKDLMAKNHWGLIGGAGFYYTLGNVRLNFEVAYKQGMSNVTSTTKRYSSDRLAGVADAMDDIKLQQISISVGCLFPMRFLSSGFKSFDGK